VPANEAEILVLRGGRGGRAGRAGREYGVDKDLESG
jgi:hypothetical protein